jgi:hypothetical protein
MTTPTRTVDDVIADLTRLDASFGAADGVEAFNHMYLTVTQLVGKNVGESYFRDPAAMQSLDVTFAGLYLAAVHAADAGARVPRAWAALFARRADARVAPIQFAIAGMNAHINHDLPVAVVRTCAAAGRSPHDGDFHADYLRVNALLAQVEQQVRESFLDGPAKQLDSAAQPVLDLLSSWSIDAARDAAWVNAEVLWHLRDLGPVRDAFEDSLARSVGLATATLLAPVLAGF